MILNETDITDYIYTAIHAFVESKINGKMYHKDCRPSDSNKEDAEIIFSTADASDIQKGIIYVNIYCKDTDNGGSRLVPNRKRITEITEWVDDMVQTLNAYGAISFYKDGAAAVLKEAQTSEHFVSVKIRMKHLSV